MTSDQVDLQRSRPYYPMHYDKDFNFLKDRTFWLGFLVLAGLCGYMGKRYYVESKRWHMWKRREHLDEVPAHHLVNRGGVVFEKEFVGFEQFHTSQKALDDWYKKAYPDVFKGQ